jgi:2-oxoacid:acceptor oxidoreductase delta subunit (pyruvate/2-ketoisovalerate family)
MRADQKRGPSLPPELATASFDEVNGGLESEAEWNRCFSCGHCTECDTCLVFCPEGIIERSEDGPYAVDSDYCKGCGICVNECPRGAMEMTTT